jgi:nucleotide-binding universal stress UspA family protein
MYQHILIPTDGSKLAHRAVTHGLSLAKAVGAKVTALVVEPTFNVALPRLPRADDAH